MTQRKLLQINAIYANSNYDDPKVNRAKMMEDMEAQFENAVNFLYSGVNPQDAEDKIDEDNPFFAPVEKGLPQIDLKASAERESGKHSGASSQMPDVEIDQ